MDGKTKKAVVEIFARGYRRATKKGKNLILTELIQLTGYNRCYARYILRNPSSQQIPKIRAKRRSIYTFILPKLRKIWQTANYACGKLLVVMIPEFLLQLEKYGEIQVTDDERKLLLRVSSSTIDRLLRNDKKAHGIKGRSGTKPGTLLKSQIPIKIFTPWNERKPGYTEIDLVAHCGDTLRGDFINTLDTVDIATGWSEKQALMGKGEYATLKAYDALEKRYPFPILGIDCDNGSEFINAHFFRMTQKRKITFTRARSGRKNDQAHIEQQNYSTVRKIVGYQRFETEKHLEVLNKIYGLLSDYLNFFIPTFKLVKKERIGSKIKRIYDSPKTPYQRVLEHPDIPEETKQKLKSKYESLNPAALLREINKLVYQLTSR